ncbi:MAG TPA: hypothetical protein VLD40_08080 [Dissulfurispiraceae bacterium]|nr:hypothetical protein [Dissulfurispiraceae bacterium]
MGKDGVQGRRRWVSRFLVRGIMCLVIFLSWAGSLSAEESVSVACYLGDNVVGDGVEVFDTSTAARVCNSMFYDCGGRCVGCFIDSDYGEDVCVDMNGRTFVR